MKRYFLPVLGIFCGTLIATLLSCNKINLPTELGLDLIPPVDNIHTFDTTIEVETYNKIFTFADDSARSILTDEQFLGVMNDPIFGKTEAQMFFQIAPASGKSTLKGVMGKRYIDSIVLSVRYIETYGDTTIPQTINVFEISGTDNFKYSGLNRDSAYSIREQPVSTAGFLGSRQIVPQTLNDSILDIRNGKDTVIVANQLRIRLNDEFGQRLLDYDTTGVNDAFSTDSAFLTKVAGLALKPAVGTSGNGLMGFYLDDTATRVTVYYRYENPSTPGDIDTAVGYFIFTSSKRLATANYIARDYSSSELLPVANDNVPDPIVYIQNTPGTYAVVKIPALPSLSNRIVHLAELQMEQIYDVSDTMFSPPPMLFLDTYDTSAIKYKTIPYSVENVYLSVADMVGTYFTIGTAGYISLGAYPFYTLDPLSTRVRQWRFNLTRYVQNVVKGIIQPSDLRLYTTYDLVVKNGNPDGGDTKVIVQTTDAPAKGRVRLGGGNHPTQKMKMRIVYSKL